MKKRRDHQAKKKRRVIAIEIKWWVWIKISAKNLVKILQIWTQNRCLLEQPINNFVIENQLVLFVQWAWQNLSKKLKISAQSMEALDVISVIWILLLELDTIAPLVNARMISIFVRSVTNIQGIFIKCKLLDLTN